MSRTARVCTLGPPCANEVRVCLGLINIGATVSSRGCRRGLRCVRGIASACFEDVRRVREREADLLSRVSNGRRLRRCRVFGGTG